VDNRTATVPDVAPVPPTPLVAQPPRTPDRASTALTVIAVGALVVVLGAFAWSANRGFDFTDESFHLNSLRHASVAPSGGSQFASVVRVLTFDHVLGVPGYRLLGLLLLELAALACGCAFVGFLRRRLPHAATGLPSRGAVVAIAMVGATLGYSWLPRTVSYLVLAPALLCVIAALCFFLMADERDEPRMGAFHALVAVAWGAAGAFLFYTKFTSAIAGIGFALLALLLVAGWRLALQVAVVAGATFLVIVAGLNATSAFSVHDLFQSASALGAGSHNASALRQAYWDEATELLGPTIFVGVMFALVVFATTWALRTRRAVAVVASVLTVVIAAVGTRFALRVSRPPWELSPILVFAVIVGLALAVPAGWLATRMTSPADSPAPEQNGGAPASATAGATGPVVRAWCALALLLLGLPLAAALGTNTGLLKMALGAGALLALAAVALFAQWRATLPARDRRNVFAAVPLVLALVCFVFVVGRSLTRDLYRVSGSAREQTRAVPGVEPLDGLRVDAATKKLIVETVAAASQPPKVPGDIGVLTTTNLEGLAYVLDDYVVGSGWIDGSDTTCTKLKDARAELARVPLLVVGEPLGKQLDTCLRQSVPGYPDAFVEVDDIKVPGPVAQEIGPRRAHVLKRR
jgi:hypothetical protein